MIEEEPRKKSKIKNMWNKIKNKLVFVVVICVGALLSVLKIQSKIIEKKKEELKQATKKDNVSRGTINVLRKENELNEEINNSKDSYNNIVNSWNNNELRK